MIKWTLFFVSAFILACTSSTDNPEPTNQDAELFAKSTDTSTAFVYYRFEDKLLEKSSGSGHAQKYLKTKYNALAASRLDAVGKVQSGAVFPEGSLIVKELIEFDTVLSLYAILFKDKISPMADEKGWVWGYIYSNGNVAYSSSNKGAQCISCHSQEESIDYMLMNMYFP